MTRDSEHVVSSARRSRVLTQLAKLTASGRLTEEEATRLRAATGPREFDDAVRDISVRHASAAVAAAVADGRMSQDEADAVLDRLRSGEHSRSLRAYLAGSTRTAGGAHDEASR
jgi:hypothetical protein